jgi:hypothetical protein
MAPIKKNYLSQMKNEEKIKDLFKAMNIKFLLFSLKLRKLHFTTIYAAHNSSTICSDCNSAKQMEGIAQITIISSVGSKPGNT